MKSYDFVLQLLRKNETAGKLKDVRPTKKGINLSTFDGVAWQVVRLTYPDINQLAKDMI
jgi:hypothetical protein